MVQRKRKTGARLRSQEQDRKGRKRTDGLAPYLYVEARGWFVGVQIVDPTAVPPERTVHELNGPVSFDSIQVMARDLDDVYQRGPALLQERQAREQEGDPHLTGRLLNDYAVKL